MGIKNNIFALKKSNTILLSFSHPWTRDTRSNDFWVFSKMADHSLIPRSSPLFKVVVESNFPPWGPFWMSKSPPTCPLRSLIPVDCPAPPSWGKPLIGAYKASISFTPGKGYRRPTERVGLSLDHLWILPSTTLCPNPWPPQKLFGFLVYVTGQIGFQVYKKNLT